MASSAANNDECAGRAVTDLPIRETFWNIPHWAVVGVYVGGFAAAAVFAWGVWQRVRLWREGGPEARLDHLPERLWRLLVEALLQKRILSQRYPGAMHAMLFWGFLALLAGTAIATIDWEFTRLLFDWRLLKGRAYLVFELVLDVAGVLLIAGLGMATWRRFVQRPRRVEASTRFAHALAFLFVIAATGFLIEAARLAVTRPEWAAWSPFGWLAAQGLIATGLGEEGLRRLHLGTWLFHAVLVFGFIAIIPRTYFAHMIATPLNILLQKLSPRGALAKIENLEEQETFGVSEFSQFSWKRRLDFDACTECGRCQEVCCAQLSGVVLNPKAVIGKLKRYMHSRDTRPLHGEVFAPEELWACTTCMACIEECPARIDIVDTIVDLRRHLALSEGAFPPGAGTTLQHVQRLGNPWGFDPADRLNWTEGLEVPILEPGQRVEYLYWVGCSAAYDLRNRKIARSMVRILQSAGVSFGVIRDERCHGEFGRRLGEEYLYQTAAEENVATLRRYDFARILTHCPHCMNTLRNEYRQFADGAFEVVHHSQLIAELLRSGRIPLGESLARSVVYHDPCYLGRQNGEFDAPREVVSALPGTRLVEAARHGPHGLCCGGGGGQMWMDLQTRKRINIVRAQELIEAHADTVAVGCPHCLTMLEDAHAVLGESAPLHVQDIAEIVAARLPGTAAAAVA
jgi:Fe-S oxidoreductase/nitrate reductase gamma subunit